MMFRQCWKSGVYICSSVVAPSPFKTLYGNKNVKNEETGWDRVVNIFTINEYGDYSPQLSHIYQTTVFTGFVGACYGGFIFSRNAYFDFIERNEATKFRTHFEAKRELQNYVTVNFFKGALKWSWRLALFGGLYVTYVTAAATYRGDTSIFDYILGGLLSGGIYRVSYGVRGVIVGGTLGALIGLTAGCITLNLLRLTGTSYDEVYEWQDEKYKQRERHVHEAVEKAVIEERHMQVLKDHDTRVTDVS